jgi:hypothetical protein
MGREKLQTKPFSSVDARFVAALEASAEINEDIAKSKSLTERR